jgi:hypothetical protein
MNKKREKCKCSKGRLGREENKKRTKMKKEEGRREGSWRGKREK